MKESIKPYYEELKGMMENMPEENLFIDKGISEKYNKTLQKISDLIPEILFDEYSIQSEYVELQFQGGQQKIDRNQYRMKLGALIGQMRGRFDFDSQSSNGGHTFIQNQVVSVELVLNLQEKIIKLIDNYSEGTPERSFLEKVKESISTIKNGTDIIRIVLAEAQRAGISIDKLISIFT